MKQHKCWLYLLLTGWMLLGISACAQKETVTPSEPDHIILDDYEIRYKGFTAMSDINENAGKKGEQEYGKYSGI